MKIIEKWKDIKNYEGLYQISNLGRVKRIKFINKMAIINREKILKNIKNNHDYYIVRLCKNNKCKIYQVHRLVAEAFIPNPNNLPQVNHKDENKLNNNINNLEWCSSKYNCNYGARNLKIGVKTKNNGKPVYQIKNNKIINTWFNIKTAGDNLKINKSNICECCKGNRKTAGGYNWEYV